MKVSDIARLHLVTVAAAGATAGVQFILPAGLSPVPHLVVLVIVAYAAALPIQFMSKPGRAGLGMVGDGSAGPWRVGRCDAIRPDRAG